MNDINNLKEMSCYSNSATCKSMYHFEEEIRKKTLKLFILISFSLKICKLKNLYSFQIGKFVSCEIFDFKENN